MSLINQVLQDLDRRQAGNTAIPAAVKALPASARTSRRQFGWIAMAGLVLAVAVGAWSLGARSAQTPVVAQSVPTPATTPAAPTPVVVITSAPTPVVATPTATAAIAPKSATRTAAERVSTEVALAESATASLAITPPASVPPTPASPAAFGEVRIEKRSPARTPHERAEAHYQRGVAAHQQGQLDEAASAYAAALREEPSMANARQALAGAKLSQGHADDAKALLTEGLVLAPQHAGLAMTLARLHAELGDMQRAADLLAPTDAASMSAEDHAFRAAVLQRLNRHAEASDHYAAALRTAPNNGVWWMGFGMSQAADGLRENAKEAFNRARASGSLSPELTQYVEQRLRQLM